MAFYEPTSSFVGSTTGVGSVAGCAVGSAVGPGAGGAGSVVGANNRTVILEFRVDDVEAEYARLKPLVDNWVQEPTMMPWGNRSMLFRDPDGNLLNLFEPVSEDAIKRFRGRH